MTPRCFPLASNPALRTKLVDIRRSYEQLYDEANKDALVEVGFSVDATDRAKSTVDSFRRFIEEHHDEDRGARHPLLAPSWSPAQPEGDP